MKTKTLSYLKATLVAFLFLTANLVKSQIAWPFPVQNNTACDVEIVWEIAEGGACVTPCSYAKLVGGVLQSITIPANSAVNLPAQACTQFPIQDVHVVVLKVDGQLPSGLCTAVGDSWTCINSCGGTAIWGASFPGAACSTIDILYSGTGVVIQ